jgi:dipeptidyl aminopeptidase/acylaminoacyl peptidase
MTTTELIPRDVLFGNPERLSPRISPDGLRLAYIAPHEGVLNVWVRSIGSDDFEVVTDDRDRGIRQYAWAHDNRHLLYLQDKGGDENWRLYDVDLASRVTRDLTPFENVQAQIVALDPAHPSTVLVGLNKDNPQLHDVYRLDLRTGELVKILDNPGFIGWVADADLVVRAAAAPQADGGIVIVARDSAEDEWRPVLQIAQEDALATQFVGFDQPGTGLYMVTSVGANAARLVDLEVATGEIEVLSEDPQYDVTGVWVNPQTREPEVVEFLRSRIAHEVLADDVFDDLDKIRRIHDGDPMRESTDDSNSVWLFGFNTDDGPIRYYSYDRKTKTSTYLFNHRPDLEGYELAKMEPFSFSARDGLTVHGYLSFPPDVERRSLPTVLLVHGGPWARDVWGFHSEAQWFANRGYLCVQVNYRGSTGYGKTFLNAGDKQWGAAMHDDLIDAVEWVVASGYADPDRIGIYGGSYGGYAALVGATFTPDVFACAVDIVGPSNIKTLIESIPPYWAPLVAQFHTRVGNPETEADELWARSPLSRVDQIRIPMLIAQGANDPRVKQAESEQIVEAMREKGIPHEYMLFEDEGHGFAKPENRLRFYAAAERFLAHHLGGRCEEPASQF